MPKKIAQGFLLGFILLAGSWNEKAHASPDQNCKQAEPYPRSANTSVNSQRKEDEGFFEGIISGLFAATTSSTAEATSDASTELTSGKKQSPTVCALDAMHYLRVNRVTLLRDLSVGEGEHLESLLVLLGVRTEKIVRSKTLLKKDFPYLLAESRKSDEALLLAISERAGQLPV